jgi:hypothetical protein
MKRIVIAVQVGVAVTFLCLFVGRYLQRTGHGITALNIFFPYSALVAFRIRNAWWLVSVLAFGQFPLYVVLASIVPANSRRRVLISLLVFTHTTAAIIALWLELLRRKSSLHLRTTHNKSLDRSGGSVFRIKRDPAKVLVNAPPGQLKRWAANNFS